MGCSASKFSTPSRADSLYRSKSRIRKMARSGKKKATATEDAATEDVVYKCGEEAKSAV
jgi:hypothetical protein